MKTITQSCLKRNYLLLVLAGFFSLQLHAQDPSPKKDKKPISFKFSYGNHVASTGKNLFKVFNPNLQAGAEFSYNRNQQHKIGQTLDLGSSINDVLGNKLYLSSHFFYRYTHSKGPFADLGLGAGIAQQFHSRHLLQYNSESGEYEESGDGLYLSLFVGYEFSLGYDFSQTTQLPFALFFKISNYVQVPYLGTQDLPILPQAVTQLGINFKINRK